jgi:hypothetical protein
MIRITLQKEIQLKTILQILFVRFRQNQVLHRCYEGVVFYETNAFKRRLQYEITFSPLLY